MLFAMHPFEAHKLLEGVDEVREESKVLEGTGLTDFAPELTFEEMGEYEPFSAEEVEGTISLLRRFGVTMTDDT